MTILQYPSNNQAQGQIVPDQGVSRFKEWLSRYDLSLRLVRGFGTEEKRSFLWGNGMEPLYPNRPSKIIRLSIGSQGFRHELRGGLDIIPWQDVVSLVVRYVSNH